MFDLPEPFGPTTTATPGSSRTSTGSGNDLKPRSLIARRCTRAGSIAGGPDGPPARAWLLLLGHCQNLLAPELIGHLGCFSDVSRHVGDNVVLGLSASDVAAVAVDDV